MDLGINLWGADWFNNGERMLPTAAQIDYFAAKGFTNIRLPFEWESIQPTLGGPLDADFVDQVREIVQYAASQGIYVILDVHSYGKFGEELIGSDHVNVSDFSNLWGKIATAFANNDNVRFGLMNEPQLESASDWLGAVNAAISAIREAGASQQVLVPGINWTGAWSWTGSDNAQVIGAEGAIIDPADNYAFEVHQYLDDTSGQHEWVVSETIGVERLKAITDWARENDASLYLGEFGVADNPQALAALKNMLTFLSDNSDVWVSASYWVAGEANPTYVYSVQPELAVFDVPQMDILENYTGAVYTETKLADGTIRQDVHACKNGAIRLTDILTPDGELLSRSINDAEGNLRTKAVIGKDGSITVTLYDQPGTNYPYTATVYNPERERIEISIADENGALTVKSYQPDAHDHYQETSYNDDGSLRSIARHVDGQHTSESYNDGIITQIEIYNASWQLISRDSFDASGNLAQRQVDNKDGSHDISTFDAKTGLVLSEAEYSTSWKLTASISYDGLGHPTQRIDYHSDGSKVVVSYAPGSDEPAHSDHFTNIGKLQSSTVYSDTLETTRTYAAPDYTRLVSTVVVQNGAVVSTTNYDASGRIASIDRTDADGRHSVENYDAKHQDHPASLSLYDASWKLVSITYFDEDGKIRLVNSTGENGLNTLTSYVPGTDDITRVEVYVDWKLQSRTSYGEDGKITNIQIDHANGTHEMRNYDDNQQHSDSVSLYDASWKLVSITYFDENGQIRLVNSAGENGLNTLTSYVPGTDDITKVEVYVDGKLQSRTSYGEEGEITNIQTDHADGTHEMRNYDDNQRHSDSVSLYDASWKLVSITYFDENGQIRLVNSAGENGLNTLTSYVPGTDDITRVEVYVDWKLQSRTSYGENGKISDIQIDHADSTHEIRMFGDNQHHPATVSLYDSSWKLIATQRFAETHEATAMTKMSNFSFLVTDTMIKAEYHDGDTGSENNSHYSIDPSLHDFVGDSSLYLNSGENNINFVDHVADNHFLTESDDRLVTTPQYDLA
ncbi:glycoside hydrolase family 5 protein [Neorhizobium sp. LMR1-1-1.1]